MQDVRLIGLHARLHAGKDTAYDTISQEAEDNGKLAVRRAFADPLKISGMRALGFPLDYEQDVLVFMANQIKETGRVTVSWEDSFGNIQSVAISGRKLWQLYGTEAHRADDLGASFGEQFWVDNLLPLGERTTSVGTVPNWWDHFKEDWAGYANYAVVTDVRFPNEAERILELGGEVWKIDADYRLGENTDEHESEKPLPDGYVTRIIDNNGSLEEFELQLKEALADS